MEPEKELEALRARIVELTKANQELRYKNERIESLNNLLLSSASWKVTAPLRTVGALVVKAREKLKASRREISPHERQRGDPELLAAPDDLDRWPSLSVVSAVYNKAKELPFFLEGFARQRYKGDFEVIVVDDASTDGTLELLADAQKKHAWLRVERTAENAGQCRARNRGFALARGTIVFFMDGDCVVNDGYLEAHARKHVLEDALDIVLGPYNLETHDKNPRDVIASYEREPERLGAEDRQDPRFAESFLNCVTRNLSIKKRFIEQNGFGPEIYDERFSYSARGTGYGWEDVEAGYRFYEKGARIGFEPRAFVVHVTHPPAVGVGRQRLGLVENWRKLLAKHPDLPLVAREWTNKTYANMVSWLASAGIDARAELEACVPFVSTAMSVAAPAVPVATRRLRVLTYRWHCGHQYELWKLPHDFTLVRGLSTGRDLWDYRSRPLPANAHFEDLAELDLSRFDVLLLHFDENVLAPENTNGALRADWGASFRHLKENTRLPTVAVCHGTPQFKGQYDHELKRRDLVIETDEAERRKLVDFLGDTLVICNSHQAEKEWGFKRSKVIWHGFDPAEYPPARRAKGILTAVGDTMKTRPHYRGYYLYEEVTRDLICDILSRDMPNAVSVQEPSRHARSLDEYGRAWFRSYVDLVREYSIFFNPTLRSPMPRSRGEAMLCGLATVSAKNHDVDRFVENGVDGFFASEPGELNEQLKFLLRDERRARAIGEAGRRKAMRVFHIDRYLAEWRGVLDGLVS